MISFNDAKGELELLSRWAAIRPDEAISLGIERRSGNWVIIISMPEGYTDRRVWPKERNKVPVIVEEASLPRVRTLRHSHSRTSHKFGL